MKRVVFVIAASMLALVSSVLSPASVASPIQLTMTSKRAFAPPLDVLTYNIGGGQFHNGSITALYPVDEFINSRSPDIIALQEVCASQRAFLESGTNIAAKYDARWAYTDSRSACGADTSMGVAILVRRDMPIVDASGFPEARMVCAAFTGIPQVNPTQGNLACSAHMPSDGDISGVTSAMKSITSIWINTNRGVVVAGDFNKLPADAGLNNLYQIGGGTGRFNEADQTSCGASPCRGGKNTHFLNVAKDPAATQGCTNKTPRKIDYIFYSELFSDRNAGFASTDVENRCGPIGSPSTFSDHKLYVGHSQNLG